MVEQFIYECYLLAVTRKRKLITNGKINISEAKLDAFVLFYFLIYINTYIKGAFKQVKVKKKTYKKKSLSKKREIIKNAFLEIIKNISNDTIRYVVLFYNLPENIKDTLYYDQGFDFKNDSFDELLKKAIVGKFFKVLKKTCSEYYSEDKNVISICSKYSDRLKSPSNKNIEKWDLYKAISYDTFMKTKCDVLLDYSNDIKLSGEYSFNDDKECIKEALLFHGLINSMCIDAYSLLYKDPDLTHYHCTFLVSDFYSKRREFLSRYYNHKNPYIQIVAFTYSLPLRAFNSLKTKMNIDFQDMESYLRRLNLSQIMSLKDACGILFMENPLLPDNCSKGWKTIWHKPTLEEVLDEEINDETTRLNQSWAIIDDDYDLGMGFTKYKGTIDDTVTKEVKVFSKKDHENGTEKGFSEFYVNPDGKYGIASRKIFGNYLWGKFEEQSIDGWVCPRFWTTVAVYTLLFILSPICDLALLFGLIGNDKVFSLLLLFGSILPVFTFLYLLKYLMMKLFELIYYCFSSLGKFIDNSIESITNCYSKNVTKKTSKKIKNVSITISLLYLSTYILSTGYSLGISLIFSAVLVLYGYYCIEIKKNYKSIWKVPYGKYAVFLFVSVNVFLANEFFIKLFSFLFILIYNNIVFVIGGLLIIVAVLVVINYISTYVAEYDLYIRDFHSDSDFDVNNEYEYISKIVMFCIGMFFIGESVIYSSYSESTVSSFSYAYVSVFLLLNFILYKILMIFAMRPDDINREKTIYSNSYAYGGKHFDRSYYIEAARNNWFSSRNNPKESFEMVYRLFHSVSRDSSTITILFSKIDNKLLFELNCLKTRSIFRQFNWKEKEEILNSIIFGKKTTHEAIKRFDKKRLLISNFFDIFASLIDVIIYIFTPLMYMGKTFVKICSSLYGLYTFSIKIIHKWCPYSNVSMKF